MNTDNMIFVFGSNLGGIHGAGAAAYAVNKRGAAWGMGVGPTGQSYAIPTKGVSNGRVGKTLPIETIRIFVEEFLDYVANNPKKHFQVTCIGCGLAGLRNADVAPLFSAGYGDLLPNIYFDEKWKLFLRRDAKFWGTF